MKKVILCLSVVAAFIFASCGNQQAPACSGAVEVETVANEEAIENEAEDGAEEADEAAAEEAVAE